MTFTHTTTGATNRSSIVRGDVALVSGTWRAKGTVSGTVVTGGTVILAHDVTVGSAGVTSGTAKVIFSQKNVGGSKATENGSIGVTGLDQGNETSGDWWAVVAV